MIEGRAWRATVAILIMMLLAWRVLATPAADLWRDPPTVLGIFLFAAALRGKAEPLATAFAAAWLVGLYVGRELPLVLGVLGLHA